MAASTVALDMETVIERERCFIEEMIAFEEQVALRAFLVSQKGHTHDSIVKAEMCALQVHSAPTFYHETKTYGEWKCLMGAILTISPSR